MCQMYYFVMVVTWNSVYPLYVVMRWMLMLNPLATATATWWFAVITHTTVRLTTLDMFLYVFLDPCTCSKIIVMLGVRLLE